MAIRDMPDNRMEDRSLIVPKHTSFNVLPNTVRIPRGCIVSKPTLAAPVQPVVEICESDTCTHSN